MDKTTSDPSDKEDVVPVIPGTQTPEGVRPATIEEQEADVVAGGVLSRITGIVATPVVAVGSALAIFKHVNFRWVWTGTLVSTMGTWVQNAAKSWLIFEMTGSERWLGIDAMAAWLPLVFMLPFGGVLADRLDRRTLLIAMNLFQGLAALVVGVLIFKGVHQVWHLILLSGVIGVTQGILIPTSQSLMPSLVPHDQIRRVVALNAVQFNVCRSLGPAVSQWVVDAVGAAWCYITNSISYLFVILPLLWIKMPAANAKKKTGQSFAESFGEWMRYLQSRRDLVIVETVVFWCAFSAAPVMTLIPALTQRVLGGGQRDYSHLLSAMGVGALCAGIINAVQSKRMMAVGNALPRVLALGVVLMALGVTKIYWIAVVLMFFAGLVMVGVGNLMQATVISSVPSHLHGRIAGMHVLCFSLGVPLGSVVGGFGAEKIGVARVFQISGILLCVGVSGLIWVYRHRKIEVDHGG